MDLRTTLPEIGAQCDERAAIERLRLDIHVNLFYWHTHLSLGRLALLRPRAAASYGAMEEDSGQELIANDSVCAARSIIDLCEMIHQRIGLAPASYATEFTSCRAAMLVLIAATLRTPHESYQVYLRKGMHLIESLSSSYGQASKEAREIIALDKAVKAFAHRSRDRSIALARNDTWEKEIHNPWIGGETPAVTTDENTGTLRAGCEEIADQSTFQDILGLDDDWNDMWNEFMLPAAL